MSADILDGPALLPPEGVIPNFLNPTRNNTLGYIVLSLCLVLGTVAMFIRLYTQLIRLRNPQMEDCIFQALFVTYIVGCLKVVESPGFFVHQWDVRVKDMSRLLYIFYICSNAYSDAIGFMKAAILLSWSKIFNPLRISNAFSWACQVVLGLNVLYYVISAIVINIECTPHAKIWDKTILEGRCIDTNALYLSGTIVNLISDVVILILPQKVIWRLHTSKQKKLGVSVIFGIGIFCIIIACFRIESTVALAHEADVVYKLASLSFWGATEMLLVLLVFCVPAFPKAFRHERNTGSKPSATSKFQGDVNGKSGSSSWPRSNISNKSSNTYTHRDEHSLEQLMLTPPSHAPDRTIESRGIFSDLDHPSLGIS
ncbi:hypothetical protein K491DRAFT_614247 [Lophiostoma macrostomum CBS 122681]|uniref:Rhodopsin domain-containing protein n=1 Tax=Lophiostoma macrostomum CBS 122681 TaxID=1314788 RepID=A0A6A6SJS5_9PLEO|nr:hypothetical protein K491DRAFT_614247 [Lophiostoma macrostomum CBS 122681]